MRAPLGRIQEVFLGPDGKVRVVRVRTGRQRLCATNHKVVSVGDVKRTEGTEHSPVRGGGSSRECSLINTNAVRWDGRTKHCMLEFKS